MASSADDRSVCHALLVLLGLLVCTAATAAERVALSVDRVTLDAPSSASTMLARIDFQQSYDATPAVFILPDEANPDPASIRIVSVDTTGFEVLVAEPASEDGSTVATTIDYFAVEPFARSVQGTEMEAAVVTGVTAEEGKFIAGTGTQAISFSRGKNGTPVVLAQLQSTNNQGGLAPGVVADPWMTVTVQNPTANGFDLAIERSEDSGALTATETIAWFAIDADVDFDFPDTAGNTVPTRSTRTADVIVGHDNGCATAPLGRTFSTAPRVFGNKQTRDGIDGGWLRRCTTQASSVSLVVDEDRIADTDRTHTTERAGLVSFGRAFTALRAAPMTGKKPFDGEVDRAVLPAATGATLDFTSVTFADPFDPGVTPVVFTLPTEVDPAPATLRIRAVDRNGFEVAALEPPGEPGAHEAMTVDYVAVEPGTHRLDDGRHIEAGFLETQRFQVSGAGGSSWDTIDFTPGQFAATPALLTQIQTVANEPLIDPSATSSPFLTSVNRNLTANGAEIALERSEVTAGAITTTERIGWFAADTSVRGTLVARDGATAGYDFSSGAVVRGFDDGCDTAPYVATFSGPPLAIADKNSRNGPNGGWLRRCSAPTTTSVGLHVDEDRFGDAERDHTGEATSLFAFERAFDWGPSEPDILLMKSSQVVSDPVNTASNPKRIPGSLIDYTITASNQDKAATDGSSVVIRDLLPGNLDLFLGDLGAGAPFQLVDGSAPSGISFDFIAVDSPADDVDFTDDAGASPVDWSYQPSVSGDYDPAVEGFRIRFDGALGGQTGPTAPSFSIRYRARLE